MQYALIAAALIGSVAASPAWAPPAYGGDDSWGSASTVDSTTVVTVTSCGPEVTDCPANSPTEYPASTTAVYTSSAPASSPYSPVTTSEASWGPPAYGSPSAPASVPASSPYSPEMSSSVESIPPPVYTSVSAAPPASSPYSPIGGSAPPAYPSGAPSMPAYPVPGNGTWGPSGTASGAPSASEAYPVQTGNTASGLKAGSFLAGCGALAALLL